MHLGINISLASITSFSANFLHVLRIVECYRHPLASTGGTRLQMILGDFLQTTDKLLLFLACLLNLTFDIFILSPIPVSGSV